jgi:hypothetical protein
MSRLPVLRLAAAGLMNGHRTALYKTAQSMARLQSHSAWLRRKASRATKGHRRELRQQSPAAGLPVRPVKQSCSISSTPSLTSPRRTTRRCRAASCVSCGGRVSRMQLSSQLSTPAGSLQAWVHRATRRGGSMHVWARMPAMCCALLCQLG